MAQWPFGRLSQLQRRKKVSISPALVGYAPPRYRQCLEFANEFIEIRYDSAARTDLRPSYGRLFADAARNFNFRKLNSTSHLALARKLEKSTPERLLCFYKICSQYLIPGLPAAGLIVSIKTPRTNPTCGLHQKVLQLNKTVPIERSLKAMIKIRAKKKKQNEEKNKPEDEKSEI